MSERNWTCLHDGPRHDVDLQLVRMTREHCSTEIAIHRCATCGGLYRWERSEINDWSGGNDYSDTTEIWQVLAADETENVRTDPNYTPRDGREHRTDTGWRRDGA